MQCCKLNGTFKLGFSTGWDSASLRDKGTPRQVQNLMQRCKLNGTFKLENACDVKQEKFKIYNQLLIYKNK